MKIEISDLLTREEIEFKINKATIVDEDGDYILIPKNQKFKVYDKTSSLYIDLTDICFIERHNDLNYVTTKVTSFETTLNLYQFPDLANYFIRINKYTVVNSNHITSIKPALHMKFNIKVLDKWLDVNRTYYYDFKDYFGL